MKKLKPYGFILSDKKGNGKIKRFFNSDTIMTVPASHALLRVNIAQDVLDFNYAFNYVKKAAKEHDLNLKLISAEEYHQDSPIKNLLKKLKWTKQ